MKSVAFSAALFVLCGRFSLLSLIDVPGASMTFRPHRAFAPSVRVPRVALAALGAACVIFGANPGDARAQASDASAASATAAASSAGGAQYAVKPGQSLGDIASELTGSKDRATREKMARALFDANPGAFMGHDPSRLKLGSVLTVPTVDLGGASAAVAASASGSAAAVTAGSATRRPLLLRLRSRDERSCRARRDRERCFRRTKH